VAPRDSSGIAPVREHVWHLLPGTPVALERHQVRCPRRCDEPRRPLPDCLC
jgi:hypothetical protein